jgi:hypothetical protein
MVGVIRERLASFADGLIQADFKVNKGVHRPKGLSAVRPWPQSFPDLTAVSPAPGMAVRAA